MIKYVISYDEHTKGVLEKEQGEKFECENSDGNFKNSLIDILCKIDSINSIDWVNNTTITFTTSDDSSRVKKIAKEIDKLEYCVDYYLSIVAKYDDNSGFAEKFVIRNEVSVSSFKDSIKERCERMK